MLDVGGLDWSRLRVSESLVLDLRLFCATHKSDPLLPQSRSRLLAAALNECNLHLRPALLRGKRNTPAITQDVWPPLPDLPIMWVTCCGGYFYELEGS